MSKYLFPTYPKINSIFKRDGRGRIIEGEYSTPEIEYLAGCDWVGTEKVDGQNIRVCWDGESVSFMARTDKGVVQREVERYLESAFTPDVFRNSGIAPCVLYGEGYGHKVQEPVGSRYCADGSASFILFDVMVLEPRMVWVRQEAVPEIAASLFIDAVSATFIGPLREAVSLARWNSHLSLVADDKGLVAEGLVLRPAVEMSDRMGNRIITKVKVSDFK
jgi:hypothetical protein